MTGDTWIFCKFFSNGKEIELTNRSIDNIGLPVRLENLYKIQEFKNGCSSEIYNLYPALRNIKGELKIKAYTSNSFWYEIKIFDVGKMETFIRHIGFSGFPEIYDFELKISEQERYEHRFIPLINLTTIKGRKEGITFLGLLRSEEKGKIEEHYAVENLEGYSRIVFNCGVTY